jgi:hypothetical protein
MPTDDPDPARGPKQQPNGQAAQPTGTGSTSTNGYWVHDDVGPKYYISADAHNVPDLNALLAKQAHQIPGLVPEAVDVSVVGPTVYIDGTVPSRRVADDVNALIAQCAVGLTVTDCLVVTSPEHAS